MQDPDAPPRLLPARLLEALERGQADAAAGRTVPLGPVLARLRESIARMEARQGEQDAEAVRQA